MGFLQSAEDDHLPTAGRQSSRRLPSYHLGYESHSLLIPGTVLGLWDLHTESSCGADRIVCFCSGWFRRPPQPPNRHFRLQRPVQAFESLPHAGLGAPANITLLIWLLLFWTVSPSRAGTMSLFSWSPSAKSRTWIKSVTARHLLNE